MQSRALLSRYQMNLRETMMKPSGFHLNGYTPLIMLGMHGH
jgi:hypothetical protein